MYVIYLDHIYLTHSSPTSLSLVPFFIQNHVSSTFMMLKKNPSPGNSTFGTCLSESGMLSFTWWSPVPLSYFSPDTSSHIFLPLLFCFYVGFHVTFWQFFFPHHSWHHQPSTVLILIPLNNLFLGLPCTPIPSQSPALLTNLTTSSLWPLRMRMLHMLV